MTNGELAISLAITLGALSISLAIGGAMRELIKYLSSREGTK
jgi:hypothetical protein